MLARPITSRYPAIISRLRRMAGRVFPIMLCLVLSSCSRPNGQIPYQEPPPNYYYRLVQVAVDSVQADSYRFTWQTDHGSKYYFVWPCSSSTVDLKMTGQSLAVVSPLPVWTPTWLPDNRHVIFNPFSPRDMIIVPYPRNPKLSRSQTVFSPVRLPSGGSHA